MRHGIAEEPNLMKPDSERVLTEEGKKNIHLIGKKFRSIGMKPSIVISSPYARAVQTADIMVEELGFTGDRHQDNRITPSGRYESFAAMFQEFKSFREILVVSHDPCVSFLTANLCGAGTMNIDFKTGAIACIGIGRQSPPVGSLLWYAPPTLTLI